MPWTHGKKSKQRLDQQASSTEQNVSDASLMVHLHGMWFLNKEVKETSEAELQTRWWQSLCTQTTLPDFLSLFPALQDLKGSIAPEFCACFTM